MSFLRGRGAFASPRAKARAFAFFAGLGVLTALTSLPGRFMPSPNVPLWDKWAHGLSYLFLGVLVWRWGLAWDKPLPRGRLFVLVAGFCAAWGVLDELHQLIVPRRACDPADMLMDALGGLLAAALCSLARGPAAALLGADLEGWLLRLPPLPPDASAPPGPAGQILPDNR
jgi:VanZ family protein